MSRAFSRNRQRNSQTINRLSIVSADLVDKKVLNNFLISSAPDSLKLFHLEYKAKTKNILDGLSWILATVTDEIYLDGLTIDTEGIKTIIEASFTVRRLVFKDCKINLTDHLFIDITREYKFAELWFFDCSNSIVQGKSPRLSAFRAKTDLWKPLELEPMKIWFHVGDELPWRVQHREEIQQRIKKRYRKSHKRDNRLNNWALC